MSWETICHLHLGEERGEPVMRQVISPIIEDSGNVHCSEPAAVVGFEQ